MAVKNTDLADLIAIITDALSKCPLTPKKEMNDPMSVAIRIVETEIKIRTLRKLNNLT